MTNTPIGTLRFDDDGVLWHDIRPQTVVRDHHVAPVWEAIRALVGDRRFAAVVDLREVTYAKREVRDGFSTPPTGVNEVATSLVVGSSYTALLGSLFLKISRPQRPVKLFTDPDEAAAWARERVFEVDGAG